MNNFLFISKLTWCGRIFCHIVNKTLDGKKLYQGSAGERRRKTFESKRGNCRTFFCWRDYLILFLVLVWYERERKKSYEAQLDTQLISNILKQVCMCGRTLILNGSVVYVVHSVIVTNSIFLLVQLTSPAWAFAFLAFRSWSRFKPLYVEFFMAI